MRHTTTHTPTGDDLGIATPPQRFAGQARTLITADTEQELRSDLERLHTRLDVEFAARIRDARATGDGAGGDDYMQIREEELVVCAEIARIEALLAGAEVVSPRGRSDGSAGIGSIVEVRDLRTSTRRLHMITGDYDRGRAVGNVMRVSASSPVGSALIGRGPGEVVEIELPDGSTRSLEIVAVSQPAADGWD